MTTKAAVVTIVCLALLLSIAPAVASAQGRITQAALGTGVTDKFEIVNPTTEFSPATARIYCAWKTEGVKGGVPIRGVWIAEDVGKAAPANYKIDQATLRIPLIGPSQGSFSISKPNTGFPVGKYRLEIYLDNVLARTVPFTVKAK